MYSFWHYLITVGGYRSVCFSNNINYRENHVCNADHRRPDLWLLHGTCVKHCLSTHNNRIYRLFRFQLTVLPEIRKQAYFRIVPWQLINGPSLDDVQRPKISDMFRFPVLLDVHEDVDEVVPSQGQQLHVVLTGYCSTSSCAVHQSQLLENQIMVK